MAVDFTGLGGLHSHSHRVPVFWPIGALQNALVRDPLPYTENPVNPLTQTTYSQKTKLESPIYVVFWAHDLSLRHSRKTARHRSSLPDFTHTRGNIMYFWCNAQGLKL